VLVDAVAVQVTQVPAGIMGCGAHAGPSADALMQLSARSAALFVLFGDLAAAERPNASAI